MLFGYYKSYYRECTKLHLNSSDPSASWSLRENGTVPFDVSNLANPNRTLLLKNFLSFYLCLKKKKMILFNFLQVNVATFIFALKEQKRLKVGGTNELGSANVLKKNAWKRNEKIGT